MEDKKKKKEDKKKREASQKVTEQKIKVPESSKPPSTQTPATPGSVSPSPGPAPPSSPCPAAGVAVPPAGNNAKRAAVANGQPPSSGTQPPQQQRYMPREVPPRFRCQQDQKVLLKRGQPPLSSMLLGGGSGRGATPPLHGDAAGATDPNLASSSSSPPHSSSSSSSVAASSPTTTSTYANSTWGAGSGSQPPSQGWEKVIVDGSDLEEWPSIVAGARVGPEGGEGAELDGPNSSSSASWSERSGQQPKGGGGGGVSGTGSGSSESPSSPRSSPPSASSSLNECVPSGAAWGAPPAQAAGAVGVVEGGPAAATALYNSKVSPLPGSQEGPGGVSSGGGLGANFHPNTNPSAWPALVQDGTPAGVVGGTTEGGSPSSSITSPFSASGAQPLSSVNPSGHRQQHLLQDRPTSDAEQHWGGGLGPEMGVGGPGPNTGGADGIMDCGAGGGGSGNLSGSSSSSSSTSSSWRAMPPPSSSDLNTGASKTDGWGGGGGRGAGGGAQGQEGSVWGFGSHGDKAGSAGDKGWGRGNEGSSNTPAVSQGAWDRGPEGEYGSAGVGGGGSGNLATGSSGGGRGGSSSNSNSSGASGGGGVGGGVSQDSASPTFATMTRAWAREAPVRGVVTQTISRSTPANATALNRAPTLKWPYRACSVAPTWIPGCCPTPGGGRPRSVRMWPGTWKHDQEGGEEGGEVMEAVHPHLLPRHPP